jgi:hypothetical protein
MALMAGMSAVVAGRMSNAGIGFLVMPGLVPGIHALLSCRF